MIAFDEPAVRRVIRTFRRTRGIDDTPVTVVERLDRAIAISQLKGPDTRWRTIPFWTADDDPGDPPTGYEFREATTDIAQAVLDGVLAIEGMDAHAVLSVSRWARFSLAMRDAHYAGLGWLVPVHRELVVVPMPHVRTADGQPNVLHDDTGLPAVEWADGSASYFLNGRELDHRTYTTVIGEPAADPRAGETSPRRSL